MEIIKAENPTVSILMPVYNAEAFLEESLLSIINQTYKNFELIIINDGSTDSSLKILEKYSVIDSRIVLISRENRGLIQSLNEAINISKGKFLARMDSDDLSFAYRLEGQLKLMREKKLDICGCHYFIIDQNNKYLDSFFAPLDNESLLLYLIQGVPFAHGSVVIRKKFLDHHKIYYGENFEYAEDKALWHKMYNLGARFGNVNDFLFSYRELDSSLSKNRANLIYADHKQLKVETIKKYQDRIFLIIKNSLSLFKSLPAREREYLSDTLVDSIIYGSTNKLSLIKFFWLLPNRYKALSILKKIRR
jgi:glycosyltransferase involved in cell wall biosynthesis